MKRVLIPALAGLAAMLLAAYHITAMTGGGGAANKTPGQDDERAKRLEMVLGLREMLYCDRTLDGLLASSWMTDDSGLKEVIEDIRRGSFREAKGKLDAIGARQNSESDDAYWLAVAKVRQAGGDKVGAREAVLRILRMPAAESRQKIQAWKVLRELGHEPGGREASMVLGVVVEMGHDEGTFIVAGYADGDARMLWTTGGGLLGSMQEHREVTEAAKNLVKSAGPATALLPLKVERPLATPGRVRFAILTPAGMHVADEKEADVLKQNHRLHAVYRAMHELLAHLFRLYRSREGSETPGG
jgi:hypothetical protein